MMSKITHDCYISNQHSEPDLKGAEGNLRCNTWNPIRPACTRECGEEGGPLMNLQALLDFDPAGRNVLTPYSS